MVPLTVGEIAAITGGTLCGGAGPHDAVTGAVEFDSRRVDNGGVFVAIAGSRVDGHDFAEAAHAAGAVVTLATRSISSPGIVVPDVLAALAVLARHVVDQCPDLTVVGVTGSQGKTSVKDLLSQLLPALGATIAPPGSFNNELGHPITALRVDAGTRFLVAEMGSRGIGHLAWLAQVAPPRIGVVLNVGAAHVGEFGSVEVTAQAKGELVEALPPADRGGVAVLNADDPRVSAMAERTAARTVYFGYSPDADVRAEAQRLDSNGRPTFTLVTPDGQAPVGLTTYGAHQISNALAAAAVAHVLGMPTSRIAALLSAAQPLSDGRMAVTRRADGITIINDAYNANPESMRAALQALVAMTPGKSWAVLGYMAELGADESAHHEAVGKFAAARGVDHLVVIGEAAAPIHKGFRDTGAGDSTFVDEMNSAIGVVTSQWQPGDTVLIKASNAVGLQAVARALIEAPAVERNERSR